MERLFGHYPFGQGFLMVYHAVDPYRIHVLEDLLGTFCGRYAIEVPGDRVEDFHLC